jgi:hypothetical protein
MRLAATVSGSILAVVLSMPSTAFAEVDCIGPVGQANAAVDWSRKPIVAWECFKEGGQEDVQKQVGQDVNGTDIPGANIQIKLDQASFDAHYKDEVASVAKVFQRDNTDPLTYTSTVISYFAGRSNMAPTILTFLRANAKAKEEFLAKVTTITVKYDKKKANDAKNGVEYDAKNKNLTLYVRSQRDSGSGEQMPQIALWFFNNSKTSNPVLHGYADYVKQNETWMN